MQALLPNLQDFWWPRARETLPPGRQAARSVRRDLPGGLSRVPKAEGQQREGPPLLTRRPESKEALPHLPRRGGGGGGAPCCGPLSLPASPHAPPHRPLPLPSARLTATKVRRRARGLPGPSANGVPPGNESAPHAFRRPREVIRPAPGVLTSKEPSVTSASCVIGARCPHGAPADRREAGERSCPEALRSLAGFPCAPPHKRAALPGLGLECPGLTPGLLDRSRFPFCTGAFKCCSMEINSFSSVALLLHLGSLKMGVLHLPKF